MRYFRLDKTLQPPSIETIEEKYDLDKHLGGYMNLAKSLVTETAGTVGLNLANDQVKTFLTQYIPSIIINVTNIYGVKIGGKLLSQIQMTLVNNLTGAFGFGSIMDTVITTVGLGSAAILGFSDDEKAIKELCSLLQEPMTGYAKTIGYASYIPKAVSIIPFTGRLGSTASQVGDIIGQSSTAYKQVREIYLTPFTLLSDWMADHTVQLAINEIRDPYLNKTLIPAFQKCVDELLPKRDIISNFDPLETQNEHAYDVTKKTLNFWIAQYQEFKENSNILVYFLLELSEELVTNPMVQDAVVRKVAGDDGKRVLDGVRNTYEFASDEASLSKTIAQWMQGHFEQLAVKAAHAEFDTVREHAELFKQAFSGKILTKDELDTIKGKWAITKTIDAAILKGYNVLKEYMVKSSREQYEKQINKIKDVIENGSANELDELLNSTDSNQQFVMRYILLKNQRLNFKSKEYGLPISPLMYAIETGNLKLVILLVEHCNINDLKNEGKGLPDIDLDLYSSGITPLQFAVMKGYNEIATYLIDKGADCTKSSIIGHATPLMIAAKNGNVELVTYLTCNKQVVQGIDSKGFRGRSALHYAMKFGHMETAGQLIDEGADLFLKDANGDTPIGLLYKQCHKEYSEGDLTKEQFEQKLERLLQTLKSSIEHKVERLVCDNKAYPIVRNYLHFAINIGCRLSIINNKSWFYTLFEHDEHQLISKLMRDPHNSELINAEMEYAVTNDIDSAVLILQRALSRLKASEITSKLIGFTYIEVINKCLGKLLLPKTDPNVFPFVRFESLDQSVINSIIQRDDFYKLDTEALVDIFNHQIKNGQIDSVKLILKKVPKLLDQKDASSNTPLHYSLKFGRYELTQFLLDQGADISLKNKNGDTAYEYWSKDNTFLKRVLDKLTIHGRLPQNDVLAKAFALNVIEITKRMDVLDNEINSIPEKERYKKIYDVVSNLINQDNNDEVRNEVISRIVQRRNCDLEVFSVNKNTSDSLFIKAILKKDYKLFDVFIKNLLAKYPLEREDICQSLVSQLLSAAIPESEMLKGMEVILQLPDNENNALLLLSDGKLRLPSEIAFQHKKYAVMEYLLNLVPQNVSLKMMDYILSKNLPCAEKVFDVNQRLIADLIKYEDVGEVALYLSAIWNRPKNDFNLKLFKTYFLNASGEALNQFLNDHKNAGYMHNYSITTEQFASQFNEDELTAFIEEKLKYLSDIRKLEFLELAITKGRMGDVRTIIEANPYLLNLQLPSLGNRTPLHMAINDKNWKMAHYLILKGCLVNLKNSNNNSAYDDWFRDSWDNSKTDKILSNGSDLEKLNAYSRKSGCIELLMLFHTQEIDKNIDINTPKEEKIKMIAERIQMILTSPNQNILKKMPMEDYLNATQVLIEEQTKKHAVTLDELFSYKLPNTKGNTLLHQAINTKNKMMTDFILEYPVKLDLQNNENNTPLHLAINNDDPNTTEQLIKLGAAVDLLNNANKTASELIEDAGSRKTSSYSLFKSANLIGGQSAEFIAMIAEIKRKSNIDSPVIFEIEDVNEKGSEYTPELSQAAKK